MARQVKLSQVALAAGVSRTTASGALNNSGRVSEATRAHVLKVAESLGYRANAGARALRIGSSPILGILLRNRMQLIPGQVEEAFWPRLLFALIEDLTANGVGVITVTDANSHSLRRLPVDAILTVGADLDDDAVFNSLPPEVPTIVGGHPTKRERVSTIGHDYTHIVADVMEHLVSNNGDQPALLILKGISPIWLDPTISGYEQWCSQRSIRPRIVEVAAMAEIGRALAPEFEDGCNAVYVLTGDNHAALRAITQECGKRVPDDVLLVGLGESPYDVTSSPPISIVSMLGAKSGHVVADLALRVIADGVVVNELLPYRLTQRASSAMH